MEKTVKKIAWYSFLTLIMVVIIGAIIVFVDKPQSNLGSVETGQGYYATTTAPNATGYVTAVSPFLIKASAATLGSINVTSAGTAGGRVNFYNATTTNVNLRAAKYASTTITILSIPTDLAAGTYTFDTEFPVGLIGDWTGTIGTSTITYR